MIYTEIEIQNFRGIKKLAIKNLSNVNLFVGKNNSGKTSVLEAIFLTTGLSNPQLAITIDLLRSLKHDDVDDFKFIFFEMDYNNSPLFEATLQNKEIRTLNIKPTLKSGAEDKTIEGQRLSASTKMEDQLRADGITFDFSTKGYHSPKNSQKASIFLENNLHRITAAKNYKESLFGVFLATGSGFQNETAPRLEKVILDKKKGDIIEVLQIVDKNIRDIVIGTKSMIYLDIGLKSYIPSNIEGEGLNRLLSYITTIYSNKNGIVIIDEIENAFHYKVFAPIWKAIVKAAKLFNVQLFISTHNIELLQQLKLSLEDPELKDYQGDVSVYSLIKKLDKSMIAIQYSFSQFENAIENEIEIR